MYFSCISNICSYLCTYNYKSFKTNTMQNTKQITITLTEEEQEKGRELARKTLGRPNLSGWISFMINQESNKND